MKLVHEVKMEVDSRDEARHTEKSKPDVEFPYGVRLFSKCGSGSISAMD